MNSLNNIPAYTESSEQEQQKFRERIVTDPFFNAPIVHTPTPTRPTKLKHLRDSFMLNWAGQLVDELKYTNHYGSKPIDHSFDPFTKENIEGYEEYAPAFIDVINKEHMETEKNKIDRNLARRKTVQDSNRIWLDLASGFTDPLSYIVPGSFFVRKGINYGVRALKSGVATGVAVGATEPIRQTLDPTATFTEGVAMISTSMLAGGFIGGFLGNVSGGVRANPANTKMNNDLNTALYAKQGTFKQNIENYFKAHLKTEGSVFWEDTKISLNLHKIFPSGKIRTKSRTKAKETTEERLDLLTAKMKPVVVQTKYKSVRDIDLETEVKQASKQTFDEAPEIEKKFVKYNEAEESIDIDVNYAVHKYKTQGANILLPNGEEVSDTIIQSADDFINFNVRKEVYRELYAPSVKGLDDAQLNAEVLKDVIAEKGADFSTKGATFFKEFAKLTPFGQIIDQTPKLLKGKAKRHINFIQNSMLRLIGDDASLSRATELGIANGDSVFKATKTKHFQDYVIAKNAIDDIYKEYLGIDPKTGAFRSYLAKGIESTKDNIKATVSKLKKQSESKKRMTERDFYENLGVFKLMPDQLKEGAVLHGTDYKLTDVEIKMFEDGIKVMDGWYGTWNKALSEFGMMSNQNSYLNFRNSKALITDDYKALRESIINDIETGKKQGADWKNTLDELDNNILRLDEELEGLPKQVNLESETSLINNYLNRQWLRDDIMSNVEAFKGQIRLQLQRHPEQYNAERERITRAWIARTIKEKKPKPTAVQAERYKANLTDEEIIDNFYHKLLDEEVNTSDVDGVQGWSRRKIDDTNENYSVGNKYLLSRIKLDDDLFIDYIDTNVDGLMNQYFTKMAPAYELTKQFGDQHLIQFKNKLMLDLLKDNVPKNDINKIINGFEDVKNQLLGTSLNQNVMHWSRQTATIVRNYATVTQMGKAVFNAFGDTARLPMVHGFANTFEHAIKPFFTGLEIYTKQNSVLKKLAPLAEIETIQSVNKYVDQGGETLGERAGGVIGKTASMSQRAQIPFFMLNGLTQWTATIKRWSQGVSLHRFIEDSIKWNAGTLDNFGQQRLIGYGIDKRTAQVIANMPHENLKGSYVTNALNWDSQKGGLNARRKLQNALFADTERTIITPSIADKPNMMTGVIRINSEGFSQMLDNKFFRIFSRRLGYTKENFGGKFSNAYLGLMLQFYTWSFGANRRLLISTAQDRDVNKLGGITALISFGIFADALKSGNYYSQKPFEEKILRGVELSGVTGLMGDVNAFTENVTGGLMNEPIGVRPSLGMKPRFGDQTTVDAAGEVIGAGPSIFLDLIYGIGSDNLTAQEKASLYKRLVPTNNLFYLDSMWKSAFQTMVNR